MQPQPYELHITLEGQPLVIKQAVETQNWSFSMIDGDPGLGKGVRCYATKHIRGDRTEKEVISVINAIANTFQSQGLNVIRRKVERIIFDTKQLSADSVRSA